MSRQDLYERILQSLHACAFDDARWPAASGLVDEFWGTKGNFLTFSDEDAQDAADVFFSRFCYRGQRHAEFEREYFGFYHAVDEALPRMRRLPDSQVTHIPSLFTEEERKTSLVYNEAQPRSLTRDGLNVRLDGPDGSRIVLTIADPVEGDGWSVDRIEAVRRLLPHLRQYVRVRQALVNARALGASAVELLDNVRMGVIQLDRRGRVVAANDRARDILRRRDGLTDRDRDLRAVLPEEDAALQTLLARALPYPGGPGAGGSMTVSRADSVTRLVLHVSPVGEAGPAFRQSRIGALVLTVDPASPMDIDVERVADILGLTQAESRLAILLAEGSTIRDIAVETGRSTNTIRWHIRHIYTKQGLSRQVELVRLVMALLDVPGVRR